MAKSKKVTPLMQQYFQVKSEHPDALLLFRVGDFYETFGEDAIKCSNALGIVLTSRNNGGNDIELAGFPYHSLDLYLPKLVKAGFRVAICEQLEKPSKEKKIVKRGVTDVVTPGITYNETILDHKTNNFLAAVHQDKKDHYGIAFIDISTGEFYTAAGPEALIQKLIQTYNPSELIYSREVKEAIATFLHDDIHPFMLDEWIFSGDYAVNKLKDHFGVSNFKGFGIDTLQAGQTAAGAIIHYLSANQQSNLSHIQNIQRIQNESFVWLDQFTIRNLELVTTQHNGGKSLIHILDQTQSAMGARMLKRWVLMPLVDAKAIEKRLNIVAFLIENDLFRDDIRDLLVKLGDLERYAAKLSVARINPKELHALARSIELANELLTKIKSCGNSELEDLSNQFMACEAFTARIKEALVDEPPVNFNKGQVISSEYNEQLKEWRSLVDDSKSILLDIQQREIKATGISNLKIGFNNVFGYYLEVTNKYKNQGLVPDTWIRKQTLTGSERYISDELKSVEEKILNAQGEIEKLEHELYEEVLSFSQGFVNPLLGNAKLLARLDCLSNFAQISIQNDYHKPQIDDSKVIDIKGARHPVIEMQLEHRNAYIANDILLDDKDQQIIMITGPNMSGKSAVLRQTALICIMAQMGCYVPATAAKIGILEKIFTRVGASDNISSGESTFMVEMNETSSIMNNICDRSLILLDEIGRGTSTYDGISIAWSIAEFLHENKKAKPKTLFATHYHELNELANRFERIKNYHISTKELKNQVVFLRKLTAGGSEHSFGIHVAKMAGMPQSIIKRAYQILNTLEDNGLRKKEDGQDVFDIIPDKTNFEINIFESLDPDQQAVMDELIRIDINAMTPLDCMMKLAEIKKILEQQLEPGS